LIKDRMQNTAARLSLSRWKFIRTL